MLLGCRETIRLALGRTRNECVETSWTDAGDIDPPEWLQCGDANYAGGTILESGYRIVLKATPEEVWEPILKVGGKTGWYSGNFLWALRGLVDRLVGGIGHRRGRRHPHELCAGDAVDFFRVLEVTPPHRLQLLAEMIIPGEAILQFDLYPLEGGGTEVQELARYLPRGLLGLIYWYALYPFNQWVLSGMLRGIAKTLGRPILKGPDRFAPRWHHICYLDPRSR